MVLILQNHCFITQEDNISNIHSQTKAYTWSEFFNQGDQTPEIHLHLTSG